MNNYTDPKYALWQLHGAYSAGKRESAGGHQWDGEWMHCECYVSPEDFTRRIIEAGMSEGMLCPAEMPPVPAWFDQAKATAEDWAMLGRIQGEQLGKAQTAMLFGEHTDDEGVINAIEEERAQRIASRQKINRKIRRAVQDKELRRYIMAMLDVADAVLSKPATHHSRVGEG